MIISLMSCFRNSSKYIKRYCHQMKALQDILEDRGHTLHLTLGYGDSRDKTDEILFDECLRYSKFDCSLVDVKHGGRNYGSVVHPVRFKQLSYIANKLWDAMPRDAGIVGLVESDLIWQAESLASLLAYVEGQGEALILSPVVLHLNNFFYDSWAFCSSSQNFKGRYPYHPNFLASERYMKMDSVGSVVIMQGELGRILRWPEEDVVVGLCRSATELGATILMDKETKVYHP